MIGSQAVVDEAKLQLGEGAKDMTLMVGGATPTINGVMVLVLCHAKADKNNTGKYVEVPVSDDSPLDDQVKAALTQAGFNVTHETASEKKAKEDADKAKAAPAQAAPAPAAPAAHGTPPRA
jgi:hypothetical protein